MRIANTRLLIAAIVTALFAFAGATCSGASAPTPGLSIVAIGRDLSLDTNRLSLALLLQGDDGPVRVEDAASRTRIEYGLLDSDDFTGVDSISWHPWPIRGGAYEINTDFNTAGTWEIRAELDQDGMTYGGSTFVTVAENSSSVAVGEPAPRSDTKTGSTAEELRLITTAGDPDPALYSMSVSEAVQSGRPSVVTFSTPAFCQTATCGPQLDVVADLQSRYGDRINFIHVEVWDNPREMLDTGDQNIGRIAPAVEEWGLITEPWTFLIDSNGVVFDKFEAFTTNTQLTAAIESMLATA